MPEKDMKYKLVARLGCFLNLMILIIENWIQGEIKFALIEEGYSLDSEIPNKLNDLDEEQIQRLVVARELQEAKEER